MSDNAILIVDDSRLARMVIKRYTLSIHPHWNVIEASNGEEALKRSQDENITWMTIDYNMPGMDGLTLIEKLRQRFPQAEIALITANIQNNVKNQASELDVDFIQKPVTKEKIRAYIER
ncbi:response regulator transcription factor [Thalassomonas actiniarum]|uniref:Response regulator n=1 Tax=Thalassomonas actiniarum TaxID=485447 RepID=A0AAE9YQZ9_9GAMM|nr:response regulator [Thalassomonas actiniarum]WDD98684.1 response regulator [Thalassomonas actiniarum]